MPLEHVAQEGAGAELLAGGGLQIDLGERAGHRLIDRLGRNDHDAVAIAEDQIAGR